MSDFEEKVVKFNKFYLWLVIAVGALCAAAVICAVYIRVSVGIVIGICSALAYVFLLSDELKRSFGVKYRRVSGGIALSVVAPKGGSTAEGERYLPSRLMWLDVVALAAPEEKDKADAEAHTLFIPATVKLIEENALAGMTSLRRIVYMGSPEEWQAVETGAELEGIELVFGAESEIQEDSEE